MTTDPPYILDANVFIEAARRYYAFDLVPVFWQKLAQHASLGQIQSIDRVRQELERGNDDLADWVKKDKFGNGFASTDDALVIQSFEKIIAWVQNQSQFLEGAKADFAKGADGWLIAYAMSKTGIVVTQEVLNPGAKSRVKIPNVCDAFGIRFLDTFEMLRRLNVKFS